MFLAGAFVVWLQRLIWSRGRAAEPGWRGSRAWFAVPFVAGCLMLVLLYQDVPFHARFALSRGRFDAAARSVPSTPEGQWVPVRSGAIAGFPISEAHRFGNQVWFRYTGTSELLDFHTRYLAYLPDGPDRRALEGQGLEDPAYASVTALGGGWYYVHDWAD